MRLTALAGPELGPAEVSISLSGGGDAAVTLLLRCVPGASAVALAVRDDGQGVRLRAEVPADGGETVTVHLEIDADGALHAWSPGRHVLTLPPDERYAPAPPIFPPAPKRPLDLALVVYGTLRTFSFHDPVSAAAPLL